MNAYPDEQTFWPAYEADVAATYAEAGLTFPDSAAAFRWFSRPGYSIGAGLPPEVAAEKHLAELADQLHTTPPDPVIVRPSRLSIRDGHFWTADGQRWIWKGASDFLLYKRFLEGENVRPLLRERRYAGANLVRVFFQCHNIARFYPNDYDGYYERVPVFADILATEGFWFEATAYCDEQYIHSGAAHWPKLTDQLERCDNAVAELANEYQKNGIDPMAFAHPGGGLLCSRGSGLSDRPPARPGWDFFGWHGRRSPFYKVPSSVEDAYCIAHALKDGWNSHLYDPMVGVGDELMGFAEVAEEGRRSTSVALARSLGASCAELLDGGTIHTENGLYSRPWGPTETACALAFLGALA